MARTGSQAFQLFMKYFAGIPVPTYMGMQQLSGLLLTVLAAVLTTTAASEDRPATSSTSVPAAATLNAPTPLPIEAFAELPFVEQARISPDATHWAGIFGFNGVQTILISSLFDKNEKSIQVALPEPMQARWVRWVNNQNILVGVSALHPVQGEDWYITRTVAINRGTGKLTYLLRNLGGQDASDIVWIPHDESNQILIAAQNSIYEHSDALWPAVYRVDVTNGHAWIEVPSTPGIMDWAADASGVVRSGVGYRDDTRTWRLIYRTGPSGTSFQTVERADDRKHEIVRAPFMFLPDSGHALVIHDDDRGMSSIYEYDVAAGKEPRVVFVPQVGEVEDPIVSNDGAYLLGVTTSALRGNVHWFDSQLADLQEKLDSAIPSMSVNIVSLSADHKKMLIRTEAADTPGSVYYFDTAYGVMHRIALINEQIGDQHLAPVKVISYKARDGLSIEALLTIPLGRSPSQLPLIVMPHGGPWAQDTLAYDYLQQFLANRGYVVLQPNFRGSTGYGTDFLKKGEGQLGLAMQDDITDSVNWAVTQGLVDPRRVCIVGASYGGYAAMWGIAKDPDLYRCAISIAGVSNLQREVNRFEGDMNSNRYSDMWKRMTPDFDAVSPLNAVDRIKAPLLLIHGKKDVTVASAQSVRMYDRMHKVGKNAELVLLPLADHYYSRQVDRLTLLNSIEGFLKKYNPTN
jgi:acetyl esterase/lipase